MLCKYLIFDITAQIVYFLADIRLKMENLYFPYFMVIPYYNLLIINYNLK